jgi:hypothetical protein
MMGSVQIVFYLALCLVAYISLEDRSFIEISRHVVFVPGFFPLCCWLGFLQCNGTQAFCAFWIAAGATLFHIFVFAVSAHYDGAIYWLVQLVEIAPLWIILHLKSRTESSTGSGPAGIKLIFSNRKK